MPIQPFEIHILVLVYATLGYRVAELLALHFRHRSS